MTKLSDVLFVNERKDRAMNLIKMLELGAIPTQHGLQPLSQMDVDSFVDNLAFAAKSPKLAEKRGAFSAALIDYGHGPAECVIKVQIADPSIDQGMKYLRYCKDHGGKNECKAFPDVYWMGTVNLQSSKTVEMAVIEFVIVNDQYSPHEGIIGRMLASFHDSNYGQIIKLEMHGDPYGGFPSLQEVKMTLDKFGWSSIDLARFIEALRGVGGSIDVHAGNFGTREDGSLCVFDPLSYNF